MKKLLMLPALLLFSCPSAEYEPETYQLVIDNVQLPASCFNNMMLPNTVVTMAPPTAVEVTVWDAPDGKAIMELDSAVQRTIDMGDAPSVVLSGVLPGSRSGSTWVYVSERTATNTQGGTTITDHTSAKNTVERGGLAKGLLDLSSSRTCTGGGCNAMPSCALTGIPLVSTRLRVNYQKAP